MFRYAVEFKWCSIDMKGPNVCHKNTPYTITPPTTAPLTYGRMDLCIHAAYAKFRCYHLHVAAEISDHITLSNLKLSCFGKPTAALSPYSSLTRVDPSMVFCYCWHITSRFDVLCIQSCPSAHHCKSAISPQTSFMNKVFSPTEMLVNGCFYCAILCKL